MSGIQMALLGSSGPLTVDANNVSRSQIGTTPDALVTTIQSPNTTPSGGVPGYTFAWTYLSGSTAISISDSSAQNPTWFATVLSGEIIDATWQVTVTDAIGATDSGFITVSLTYAQI